MNTPTLSWKRYWVSLLRTLAICCLAPVLLSLALGAQSGRVPPVSEKQQQPRRQAPAPSPPAAQESRPRRASDDAQDEKPIKLSADLVTVVTSVTDAEGNQVNDLAQRDFEIYEDDAPQQIAGFYREGQMPLRLIFLFDTSSSIRHRFDFEQRAAARFFRQVLQRGDQAALMSVSVTSTARAEIETPLTSNVDELVNSLSRLKAEGATPLYDAMVIAGQYLHPSEGRHVMVVLSDGSDTASSATLAQALLEVQKADVVIYGVHSTGVAPSANVQDLAGEFVLKAMCEDTGGRAFFPPIYDEQKKESRDLDEIYRRIAAEVRAQFVLTYYSNAQPKPGTFRNIRVEVKRPGLQVRARRGYYAPK
jgi:Ca-activated chloride channel family protein